VDEQADALGDLLQVAAVQFPQPSVTVLYDSDPKAAQAEALSVTATCGCPRTTPRIAIDPARCRDLAEVRRKALAVAAHLYRYEGYMRRHLSQNSELTHACKRGQIGTRCLRIGSRARRSYARCDSNCSVSVLPLSAPREERPTMMVWVTSSKYPAPTSRWWRVAV